MFHLTTLNLNGIRSAANKGLQSWAEGMVTKGLLDCMCVQEVKAQEQDLKGSLDTIAGLRGYFQLAEKKGYSGVGIYTAHEPSDVLYGFDAAEFDAEGRCIELCFDTPARKRSIICSYFPSGSSGEERQAAKFRFLARMQPHLSARKSEREFILCGDINIAHQNIDLKNWRSNQKHSGFTPEERAWMSELLTTGGICDVYRQLHPSTTDECYTWWSNRGQAYANNVGWRLDYQLATPGLAASARSASIERGQKFSDHAPLSIAYDIKW